MEVKFHGSTSLISLTAQPAQCLTASLLFTPNREVVVSTEFLGVVYYGLSEFTYVFKTWFSYSGQDILA